MANASGNVVQLRAKKNPRDFFFAVDERTFEVAVRLGMAPAVVWLVLARGTGADQRRTTWSVRAVEKYTGIGRATAKKSIRTLEVAGLIRRLKAGARPVYDVQPAENVPGCRGYAPESGPHRAEKQNPHLIWLPNAFVSGVSGEVPPLELVRQTLNVAILNLLVSIYTVHEIGDFCGISWLHARLEFSKRKYGEQGQFSVLGFREGEPNFAPTAPFVKPYRAKADDVCSAATEKQIEAAAWHSFYDSWDVLCSLGLIDMVPYLVEGEHADGEIIHPYGTGFGTEDENMLGNAANDAGRAMLSRKAAEDAGDDWLLPVPVHRGPVTLVGVFRLRYQPKTSHARRWMSRMKDVRKLVADYRQLEAAARIELTGRGYDLKRCTT